MNDEVKNPAVQRSSLRPAQGRLFRFPRFLFSVLAAISLLLCVATVGLLIATFNGAGSVQFSDGRKYVVVGTYRGRLQIGATEYDGGRRGFTFGDYNDREYIKAHEEFRRLDARGVLGWLGFASSGYGFGTNFSSHPGRLVHAPLGFVLVMQLLIPCVWFRNWWRIRRSVSTGCCRTCGYDLRATPERCSECGEPAMKAES